MHDNADSGQEDTEYSLKWEESYDEVESDREDEHDGEEYLQLGQALEKQGSTRVNKGQQGSTRVNKGQQP